MNVIGNMYSILTTNAFLAMFRGRMFLLLTGFALLFVPTFAVTWEFTTLEIEPQIQPGPGVAVFRFRNLSAQPVVITSVVPTCDCLTPRWEKRIIAAGETGELRVEVAGDFRRKTEEKAVMVTTDDAPDSPQVLKVHIKGNVPVILSAKYAAWHQGEAPEEKPIDILLQNANSTVLRGVQCSEASFTVRLERASQILYRIVVRPTDSNKLALAPIRLDAVVDGVSRTFVVYAVVR